MCNRIIFKSVSIVFLLTSNAFLARQSSELAPLEVMLKMEQGKTNGVASEAQYRRFLYLAFKKNPFFFKLDSFKKDKDFYIQVLKAHIAKLEHKIQQKNKGFISWSTAKGSLAAFFSVCSGWLFFHIKSQAPTKESLEYIINKWDVERSYRDALIKSLLSSVGCACFTGWYFYKVIRYQERLLERLERDKTILKLIEQVN